jgi:hypothetical protein
MSTHRVVGILFWIVAAGAVGYSLVKPTTKETQSVSWVHYLLTPSQSVTLAAKDGIASDLKIATPVFLLDGTNERGENEHRLIGKVTDRDQQSIDLKLSDAPGDIDSLEYTLYRNRGKLSDAIALMMPPDKQQRMETLVRETVEAHGREMASVIVPVVQNAIAQSLPLVESELRASIDRHESEIDALADKWKRDLIRDRLVPMAREEVLPIVREHAQGPAERIGLELWDRASIWRFTWRAIYDKSPLPKQELVREEWNRFVEDEAVPILESHVDEITEAIQKIIVDTAANPQVRRELSQAAGAIAADEQTKRLVKTILRECLVDNQKLREVWTTSLASPEAKSAFDLIGNRLEPVVRKIGDELFGTPQTGISPGFARVLRSQVLGRDRSWIVAWRPRLKATTASRTLHVSDESMPYPVVHLVNSDLKDPVNSDLKDPVNSESGHGLP